ncbi:NAD-dependent epimerase/dehydratase family protein [Patescibacteria group bacterium]
MSKTSGKKHILITGGAGYVGVPTVDLLLKKGCRVRVFDNLSWGGNVLLPYLGNKNFSFVKGDVRNKRELKQAFKGIDSVIHLAAIVGYPACRKFPKMSRDVNVKGTKNVVDLAGGKIPVIFSSTGSAYGKIIEEYCTETTPLNPLSNYGRQKVKAEEIVKKNKGKYVIYRYATAFGVAPRFRLDLLINDFTLRAVTEKTLIVYQKEFMRTFIHVKDMARSLLFALDNYKKMKGQIFNVGSESMNMSKEGVAKLLQKYLNYYLHFVEVGYDVDQRDYVVDFKKIRKHGFRTTINIEEGIKELIKASEVIDVRNPYSNV